MLGAFLTWLSEKNGRVFVVATANDITALPPELIRKGRCDEIFFVDLPNAATRGEILRIHAARRGIPLDPRELTAFAEACEGFAGAEIAATHPLEVVMAEKVGTLRAWAEGHTVTAG